METKKKENLVKSDTFAKSSDVIGDRILKVVQSVTLR